MRTWQYITASIAFLGTGILLITNMLAAWGGTDDGIWRWIMLSISVAADLGLVGFLFSIIHNHQSGRMGAVFAAIIMWSLCGLYTGVSSMRWLEGQFRTATAPIKEEAARRVDLNRYIDTAVNAENVALGQAMSVSVNGSTQNKRDEAKAEAEKIRKRITELLQRKWPAAVEPSKVAHSTVEHAFIGYEWAFPLVLLFFSQGSWYVTFGSFGHGSNHRQNVVNLEPKMVNPEPITVIPANQISDHETTLLTNDEVKVRNGSQPSYGKLANQSNQIMENSPTNLTKLWKTDQQSQPNKQVETKTGLQPEPGNPVLQFVTIDDRIVRLVKAGESERNIADKLNVKRSRVQRVKKEMLSSVVSAAG